MATSNSVLAAAPAMKPSKMRDNLIEHAGQGAPVARAGPADLRLAAARAARRAGAEGDTRGAAARIPRASRLPHPAHPARRRRARQAPAPSAVPTQREVRPEPKIDRSAYVTVTSEEALDSLDRRGDAATAWSRSTPRPTAIDCVTAKLVGISLATECGKACYIPLEHGGHDLLSERPEQIPADVALAKLKPLLEDPAILKVGHNFKFDWIVFDRRGIKVAPVDDSLVMSFNLDAGGLNSHSMDDLAKKHLDHECIAYKDVCGSGQKQIKFNQVPLDRATEYAAEDADVTLRLWTRFKTRLPHERVDADLRDGRPAARPGGRRGWSARGSRSTARS